MVLSEEMQDMTFTAVIALGVTTSGGAVLDVTSADAHVRALVLEDIRETSDRDFIDALGKGLPKSGLVNVHCEMEGWPDEYDSPEYKLISASPVALPSAGGKVKKARKEAIKSRLAKIHQLICAMAIAGTANPENPRFVELRDELSQLTAELRSLEPPSTGLDL